MPLIALVFQTLSVVPEAFTSFLNLHQALSPKTQTPQGPGPELPHKPLVSITLPESHSFRNHSQIPGQNTWDTKAGFQQQNQKTGPATPIKHHFETALHMQGKWTHQNSFYFLMNIFKLFPVFTRNPTYKGFLRTLCENRKLGVFWVQSLEFFYLDFTWSPTEKRKKRILWVYKGSSERKQWKGRLFFASQV